MSNYKGYNYVFFSNDNDRSLPPDNILYENNVMVFKETKIKNIKITDAKPSANELA